jgi:hypothetical protein
MQHAYDSAELVLQAIEDNPGGLNMKMLLHETGLTGGQYRRAYNWTLDNFDEPIWIKNFVGGEWVYLLPSIKSNAMEDWKRTIRTQVTRARREHNKIHAIAKRHKGHETAQSELLARHRLEALQLERERLKA